MSRDVEAGISAKFAAARMKFLDLVEERMSEITRVRRDVAHGADAAEGLRAIAGVAHKICGVAATLGFSSVGDEAREIEESFRMGAGDCDADRYWKDAQDQIDGFLKMLGSLRRD